MRIIIETSSTTGNIRTYDIEAVKWYKKDNFDATTGRQDVILCKLEDHKLFIIQNFGSTKQRDVALKLLNKKDSSVVVLDYNTYFCFESMTDDESFEFLRRAFSSFTLQKHMTQQFMRKIEDPKFTDAFNELGGLFVVAMVENKFYYIEEVDSFASLWAKTIWVPNLITNHGISPRQFFKYLIKKSNANFTENPSRYYHFK